MPSLIPGYNCDIFISYRQKDNKGDRWVSQFVEALKNQLEATFKEDVSVYFDENPDDRLQETHDVNKSLEGKLKCLIFIPVVSQTYCDPNSYAWQFEFLPFLRMAEKDRFGKDVKLRSGNVAGRIIPVRIHDLDPEDIKLYEKETGSVLRAIDFVFKTGTGAVRPLLPNEDHPNDNLYRTFYRDQISKVAIAVKDIIHGLQAGPVSSADEKRHQKHLLHSTEIEGEKSEPQKSPNHTRRKIYTGVALIAIFIIAALLYPQIFKKDKFKEIRDPEGKISIAVLPFENYTGDTTMNWFSNGISSLIINVLGNSPELAVCDDYTMYEVTRSANQVYTAGISPAKAQGIAKMAKAKTYITGSYQGREDTYWILANLVDTETGNVISTHKIEGNLRTSAYLEMAGSLCEEIKNHLEIRAIEEKSGADVIRAYTRSSEAYRHYIQGLNMFMASEYDHAINELKRAYEIDSTFSMASFFIAYSYNFKTRTVDQDVRSWTLTAYSNKENLPVKYQYWLDLWYAWIVSKKEEDIRESLEMMEASGIDSRLLWLDIAFTYSDILLQYEKSVKAFEKVISIGEERGEPFRDIYFYTRFGLSLHNTGNHEREKEVYELALNIFNDDISKREVYYRLALCALSQNDTIAGNKYLEEYLNAKKRLKQSQDNIEYNLGMLYYRAGMMKEAEGHLREACKLVPPDHNYYIGLANFLIDSETDIKEGMAIAERMLEMYYPNSGNIRRVIALGLYKLGNYEEADKLIRAAIDRFPYYAQEFEDLARKIDKALSGQVG